jgi:tripartite-type tricarboxylate transporter receptor subunit TctC
MRLIMPFPAGGSTGYTTHVLARMLETILGERVSVEAKTDRFGIEALEELARDADGSTLMVGNITSNSMTPVLYREQLPFDYEQQVVPVTRLAEFPSVLVTQLAMPAETLSGFLAHLKRTSGTLRYGNDFLGSYVDADAVLLGKTADLAVTYRASNGAERILASLLAGEIDLSLLNVATASANAHKIKALAVTGNRRLGNFPQAPTMAEAGFAGIGTSNWQGLFASRATAIDSLRVLHRQTVEAMNTREAKQAFDAVNAEIATSASPEAFATEIKAEMAKWKAMMPEIMSLPGH